MHDWILRCEEFKGVDLKVDYGCPLMGQVDFARFRALLREVGVCDFGDDAEAVRLMAAMMNSLFWDYDSAEHRLADGSLSESLIDDLCDRMVVERMVLLHLTRIADHYKHCAKKFAGEKVILEQSLAAMADVAQRMGIDRRYTLVAHLLMLELHVLVEDIAVFESKEKCAEATSTLLVMRLSVTRALSYLEREHYGRRIISKEEYSTLVDEVTTMLSSECLPEKIKPLALRPNGALRSGFSYTFVTYGISIIYRRYSIERNTWIEYLCKKIDRPKSALEAKFTLRPTSWEEKIEECRP